eukprot:759018-Hanusia_phi.AAC.3
MALAPSVEKELSARTRRRIAPRVEVSDRAVVLEHLFEELRPFHPDPVVRHVEAVNRFVVPQPAHQVPHLFLPDPTARDVQDLHAAVGPQGLTENLPRVRRHLHLSALIRLCLRLQQRHPLQAHRTDTVAPVDDIPSK